LKNAAVTVGVEKSGGGHEPTAAACLPLFPFFLVVIGILIFFATTV
jgi:hypothetical protein